MTGPIAASWLVILFASCSAYRMSAQGPAAAPASRRQFVACPVVRDTRTQPCRLAEYDGELYYLGQQGGVSNDFYPPQGHQVLVEGTAGQGRVCGGIPLQPVKVSVLHELTPACRTMLPADDDIEAPPPVPAPRGPALSWVRVDDQGNATLNFDFDNDARRVADVLVGLGVTAGRIAVNPSRALTADGVSDPWNRKVEIHFH